MNNVICFITYKEYKIIKPLHESKFRFATFVDYLRYKRMQNQIRLASE